MMDTKPSKDLTLTLRDDAKLCFHKAYDVPFALRSVIEEILGNIMKEGKFVPVQISEWASPVVIVRKKRWKL